MLAAPQGNVFISHMMVDQSLRGSRRVCCKMPGSLTGAIFGNFSSCSSILGKRGGSTTLLCRAGQFYISFLESKFYT